MRFGIGDSAQGIRTERVDAGRVGDAAGSAHGQQQCVVVEAAAVVELHHLPVGLDPVPAGAQDQRTRCSAYHCSGQKAMSARVLRPSMRYGRSGR